MGNYIILHFLLYVNYFLLHWVKIIDFFLGVCYNAIMEYDKTLAQILEKKIKLRYRSIKEFSDKSGIPYMTISNVLKRGVENSSFGTIWRICDALNIRISSLIQARTLDTIRRKIIQFGKEYTDDEILQDLIDSKTINLEEEHYTEKQIKVLIDNYRVFFGPNSPIDKLDLF